MQAFLHSPPSRRWLRRQSLCSTSAYCENSFVNLFGYPESSLPIYCLLQEECIDQMTWDRSLHWVLVRTRHHQFDVSVVLADPLSAQELSAVRKLSPDLQETPISELKIRLSGQTSFNLGTMEGQRCRDLNSAAQKLGLRLNITNSSFTSYLPIDKTNNQAWLIEDDGEAKRIADEMIAAGVEIQDCEAD